MHFGTLHPAAATLWRQLGPALCPPGYLLCGGTALALYLGHRQSQDFDFLTMVAGDPTAIVTDLAALEPALEVVDRSPHSVHLLVRNVYVSYLWRPGVRLDPGETFDGIPVASLPTLAALKCSAVANRGSRKDFVDLYALLQSGWSLDQILQAALDHAPHLNLAHVLRSLTYFVDADPEPDPVLYRPWVWDEIKHTLAQHVAAYLRQHLPPPSPPGPHL